MRTTHQEHQNELRDEQNRKHIYTRTKLLSPLSDIEKYATELFAFCNEPSKHTLPDAFNQNREILRQNILSIETIENAQLIEKIIFFHDRAQRLIHNNIHEKTDIVPTKYILLNVLKFYDCLLCLRNNLEFNENYTAQKPTERISRIYKILSGFKGGWADEIENTPLYSEVTRLALNDLGARATFSK